MKSRRPCPLQTATSRISNQVRLRSYFPSAEPRGLPREIRFHRPELMESWLPVSKPKSVRCPVFRLMSLVLFILFKQSATHNDWVLGTSENAAGGPEPTFIAAPEPVYNHHAAISPASLIARLICDWLWLAVDVCNGWMRTKSIKSHVSSRASTRSARFEQIARPFSRSELSLLCIYTEIIRYIDC